MLWQRRKFFLWILYILFILGCAKRVSPPGGPPDETPPKITTSIPADSSTNVPVHTEISIQFNENILQNLSTVIISPRPGKVIKKFRKKSVHIVSEENLSENTTYTIILTPEFSDIRGNKMGSAKTISFSTGEYLDTLRISGWTIDMLSLKPIKDILILAYLDSAEFDNAIRIGISDKDGKFYLPNLPDKKLWLYGISGTDSEIDWQIADKISTPIEPIYPGKKKNILLPIIPNDTLSPEILSITRPDSFTVKFNFSKKIILDSLWSLNGKIWFDPVDSNSVFWRSTQHILETEIQLPICDWLGNCQNISQKIPPGEKIDTIPPSIILSSKPGSSILPISELGIVLSEPASADIKCLIADSSINFRENIPQPNLINLLFDNSLPMGESLLVIFNNLCDDFSN
ncbi:hypothetical protein DRQ33_03355, partial [bacterium]